MNSQEVVSTTGRVGCDAIVIDDYRELTAEIAEALRRRGLSTQVAFDGAAALMLAQKYNPAVALVDCTLPDIDGFHLIRQLGQAWPDTTFLVISGDVGGISEDMARQLRIHAFLNKPFPIRALAQAVERMVDRSADHTARQDAPRAWISLGIGSPARRAAPPSPMILETPPQGG